MKIYLDYSATTPPRQEVKAAVQNFLDQSWGNPASLHHWGNRAALALETARLQVAQLLNASHPDSIVFTSGGTEANHLAIFGVTRNYPSPQHLIISTVEHSAIAEPVRWLENQGWQVTRLGVNAQGRVNPLELEQAIQSNTVLISVIYGQSEVGTLQPIEELGRIARQRHIPFHTDAVQVAGRCPVDVKHLPVDLLSLSSHKLYGIQGAGALYIHPDLAIGPLLMGGGQEQGLRSGTPPLPAIVGLGVAAELAQQELTEEMTRLQTLRDRCFDLLADCEFLTPTGDRLYRLPHHVSFVVQSRRHCTAGLTGKQLVRALNREGIAISAGAACNSGKLNPSPVLLAMGYQEQQALAGIRLTFGRETTMADIETTARTIKQVFAQLCPQLTSIQG
ncbi:cysteine desulfurase family protein [Synechocystis sp. CACIAM 05]|uniref:cysteine desulfurase family protein n=1 Tax=Synechocystis sp. CACIAM 05 TaxID=1933929 RepID=UPI00138E83F0|nr:cysteine desulfurase family protein [Synechocystis sp. CACIAM 05]QHU98804.1 cysteine desulfurase [Synechocystis sp. CACIAM 05]